MKSHPKPYQLLKLFVLSASAFGLSACQTIWDTPPDFGSTVNDAVQAQLVNPVAPVGNQKVTRGLDGGAAKGAVDNYQKSFEIKAPTSSGTYPTGATSGSSTGGK